MGPALITASKVGSEPLIYEALGDFSSTQSEKHWINEEAQDDNPYQELTWNRRGYEGRWNGSEFERIGRV